MSDIGIRQALRSNVERSRQSVANLRLASGGWQTMSRMKRSLPSVPADTYSADSPGGILDSNSAHRFNGCSVKTQHYDSRHQRKVIDELKIHQQEQQRHSGGTTVTALETSPIEHGVSIDDVTPTRDGQIGPKFDAGTDQLGTTTDRKYCDPPEAEARNRNSTSADRQQEVGDRRSGPPEKQGERNAAKTMNLRWIADDQSHFADHQTSPSESSPRGSLHSSRGSRSFSGGNFSLYDVMREYDMHRLTLVTSGETGRRRSVSLLDEIDVTEINITQLFSGCHQWFSGSNQTGRDLYLERDVSRDVFGREDGDNVTLMSVTSVSNRLVAIENSRGLAIGDLLIEVNGHYLVGTPAGDVCRLLASFAVQPLRVVVATRRGDGHVYPAPIGFHQQDQSARHRQKDNVAVQEVSSPEIRRDLRSSDSIPNTTSYIIDPSPDVRNHTINPSGSSSVTATNRRRSDGVPGSSSNADEICHRKRRSVSYSDTSNVQPIDNINEQRVKFAEADLVRRQQERFNTNDIDNRRASDQFITHPSVVGTVHKNHNHAMTTTPRKYSDNLQVKVVNSDDTRPNCEHAPEVFANGGARRVQKSPHPKWLSAVFEERILKENSTLANLNAANKLMGFVPLSAPVDEDMNSDGSDVSSEGSLADETFYDDFYGWHCVSAV